MPLPPRLTNLPVFPSMGAMAGALGIPLDVLKAASKEGCPFVTNTRADSGKFISWYFSRDLSEDDKENWTTRDKRAAALLKESKLDEADRRLIEFSLCEQYLDQIVNNIFFGELERLAQEFPSRFKGKAEVQIRTEVQLEIERIKKTLTKRLEAWQIEGEKQG